MEKENFLVALAGLDTTTELDQTTFFLFKKKKITKITLSAVNVQKTNFISVLVEN